MNGGWMRHYSWRCQPVDSTKSELGMRVSCCLPAYHVSIFDDTTCTFASSKPKNCVIELEIPKRNFVNS